MLQGVICKSVALRGPSLENSSSGQSHETAGNNHAARRRIQRTMPIAFEARTVCRTGLLGLTVVCLTLGLLTLQSVAADQETGTTPDITVATDEPQGSTGASRAYVASSDDDELTEAQQANLRLMETVTFLWFLALGSVVGSFLNVVIYRLPLGRKLAGNSRCPHCNSRIQWRDNIPIIGWLRLRGRCRSCKARVPARYPTVEALIGALFVLLLAVELLSGGKNLPVRMPNHYAGVVWIIWYTKWDLLGLYLFHCLLGCVLAAAAFMQWDGHPLPGRLKWFALGTGLIAPAFWSHLHPVSFHEPRLDWLTRNWRWQISFTDPVTGWPLHFGVGLDGLVNSITGLAAGLVTGWLLARCLGPGAFPENESHAANTPTDADSEPAVSLHIHSFCALFGVAAAYLGWQTVAPLAISVSMIAVAMSLVAAFTGDARWRRRTTCASIAVAVLLQIVLWRTLSTVDWYPNHTGWPIIARTDWWSASLVEPYGSLLMAIAAGCAIARTHALIGRFEQDDRSSTGSESLESDARVVVTPE
jgi:hypothetical protein